MYPFAQCTRWEKCILQKTGTFVPAMKQWFVDVAPPPPPSPARPPPPPLHMFPTPHASYRVLRSNSDQGSNL